MMRWAVTYIISAAVVAIIVFLALRTILNTEIDCIFFSDYMVDCRDGPAS